jgi:hypothetical protein
MATFDGRKCAPYGERLRKGKLELRRLMTLPWLPFWI